MRFLLFTCLMIMIVFAACSPPDTPQTHKSELVKTDPQRSERRKVVRPAPETLFAAASEGNLEAVKKMLEEGQNIDGQDNDGVTALALASFRGHVEVVRYLLEQKADFNLRDNKDLTPLHKACLFGNPGVIDLLIRAGADVNAEGPQGVKPLTVARKLNHVDAIALLESAGALAE